MTDLSTLFRYPNATVQYDSRLNGYETSRSKLTHIKLIWLLQNTSLYRNLKLVLRKIESLTDDEAKECFRLAFGRKMGEGRPFGINREDDKIEIYSYLRGTDRLDLSLFKNGGMAATGGAPRYGGYYSPIWNTSPAVDYLRSIDIDLDGLLASGEAVEEEID